jgi:hypothetical protein
MSTDYAVISMHEKGFWQIDVYCGMDEPPVEGDVPDHFKTCRVGEPIDVARAWAKSWFPQAEVLIAEDDEPDEEDMSTDENLKLADELESWASRGAKYEANIAMRKAAAILRVTAQGQTPISECCREDALAWEPCAAFAELQVENEDLRVTVKSLYAAPSPTVAAREELPEILPDICYGWLSTLRGFHSPSEHNENGKKRWPLLRADYVAAKSTAKLADSRPKIITDVNAPLARPDEKPEREAR